MNDIIDELCTALNSENFHKEFTMLKNKHFGKKVSKEERETNLEIILKNIQSISIDGFITLTNGQVLDTKKRIWDFFDYSGVDFYKLSLLYKVKGNVERINWSRKKGALQSAIYEYKLAESIKSHGLKYTNIFDATINGKTIHRVRLVCAEESISGLEKISQLSDLSQLDDSAEVGYSLYSYNNKHPNENVLLVCTEEGLINVLLNLPSEQKITLEILGHGGGAWLSVGNKLSNRKSAEETFSYLTKNIFDIKDKNGDKLFNKVKHLIIIACATGYPTEDSMQKAQGIRFEKGLKSVTKVYYQKDNDKNPLEFQQLQYTKKPYKSIGQLFTDYAVQHKVSVTFSPSVVYPTLKQGQGSTGGMNRDRIEYQEYSWPNIPKIFGEHSTIKDPRITQVKKIQLIPVDNPTAEEPKKPLQLLSLEQPTPQTQQDHKTPVR
ncbi:hypothetical protein L3V79_08635 [Thiotrichales bacterium 19S9-12]|nr:hypothetical protein [Thiotrichales bacterium 19S9-11]MCF6812421.1 hypothetical protein [Thiotrichales bacterium 19S9-12]